MMDILEDPMVQPNNKANLAQVLKLVEQLSPADLLHLRQEIDMKAERAAFFNREEAKAGTRVKKAFESLQSQGILDSNGNLLKPGLPADMEPGSECDVGG